jgi:hypothetical protein
MRAAQLERQKGGQESGPRTKADRGRSRATLIRDFTFNFNYPPQEEHLRAMTDVPVVCPDCGKDTVIEFSVRGGKFLVECGCGRTDWIDPLVIGGPTYAKLKAKLAKPEHEHEHVS